MPEPGPPHHQPGNRPRRVLRRVREAARHLAARAGGHGVSALLPGRWRRHPDLVGWARAGIVGGLPPVIEVDTDIGPLLVPADDRVITPVLAGGGVWEPDEVALFDRWVRPGTHVLDIGAQVGYHAVRLASLTGPDGRVVAVEPEPNNHRLLTANLARHAPRHALAVPAAAAARTGWAVLSVNADNAGDHRTYPVPGTGRRLVRAVAIDDLWPAGVPLGFVKIDVQGTEAAVVAGMRRTIARWRPVMVVEFWPPGIVEGGGDPREVLAGYRALGYRLSVTDRPGDTPDEDILDAAAAAEGRYVNLLCVPA